MRTIKKTYSCGSVLIIQPPEYQGGKVVKLLLEPKHSPDVRITIGREHESAHHHKVTKIEVQIWTEQIPELIKDLQNIIDVYGSEGW